MMSQWRHFLSDDVTSGRDNTSSAITFTSGEGRSKKWNPMLMRWRTTVIDFDPLRMEEVWGLLCIGLGVPAQAFWDELQVVVGGHELLQGRQFPDARGDAVKVQPVGIQVQLLQLGQLADGRLEEEERNAEAEAIK